MDNGVRPHWLLLIHQLPPKPDYIRVKIRRRLLRLGSIAIKNTVYALPNRDAQVEDFHWLLKEIEDAGGEAYLCSADMIEGLTNSDVILLFNKARDAEYEDLAEAMKDVLRDARAAAADPDARQMLKSKFNKLRSAFDECSAVDFFGASNHSVCETLLQQIESALKDITDDDTPETIEKADTAKYQGRTWITRSNIFVDRIASAWLIRRRVDAEAHFKFVDPTSYKPLAREVRFDMYEAEFTHVGDCCTFEVLLEAFSLSDPALRSIAEIVHDLDLKYAKFQRSEAAGLDVILQGFKHTHPSDAERLGQGEAVLDALYAHFSSLEVPHDNIST
ncbi:MAG: hypothetical protein AMXMBFR84_42920 [Candidatus Hydrogenedentota bacterium]